MAKSSNFRNLRIIIKLACLAVVLVSVFIVLVTQNNTIVLDGATSPRENTDLFSGLITPTPPPTPSPEPTPTPTPTPSPTPTPTPSPTPTPTPKPTPTPTAAPVPTSSGPVWYNGFVDPRTVDYVVVSDPGSITVLINQYHALPDGYIPPLVAATNSNGLSLHPEAAEAWARMCEACETETGITLHLVYGYRSYATQEDLFYTALSNKGITHTVTYYAYPGRSEHQLGLAIDIRATTDRTLSRGFLDTPAGEWVSEHAHLYGFIMRYPAGKEPITGIGFEPWHYRYLGSALATELKTSGQTLEEYYGKPQPRP